MKKLRTIWTTVAVMMAAAIFMLAKQSRETMAPILQERTLNAFTMYTAVLDILGVAWEETYQAPPEGDDAEAIAREAEALFKMQKDVTSRGGIKLNAEGSVQNETGTQTGIVNLVADTLQIGAVGSIHGIALRLTP